MNKSLLLKTVCFAAMSAAATGQLAAETVKAGNLYYELRADGKHATLARHDDYRTMTDIAVPGTITVDGTTYTVDSIAQQAFQECTMESLTLGEGVHGIGAWGMWKCASLKELTLPSTLVVVSKSAFSGCSAIETLVLPDNLSVMGDFSFGYMTSLTSLTLPANLVRLGNNAFAGATSLTTVNFGPKLEVIEKSAFYQSGLESVTFPASLKSISEGAFSGSARLTRVVLPQSMESIGQQSFYRCYALSDIVLPEGLKSLGDAAFYECTSLASVKLPSAIGFIDANCFYGCSALKSIEIPPTIKVLSKNMFYNCSSLEQVTLPADMTEIGNSAFYGCASLRSISLPKGITRISADMFNRAGITSIDIPEGVTAIENNGFRLSALTRLHIPSKVSSIAGSCVLGCDNLTEITVADDNQTYAGLDGALVSKDKTRLIDYPAGRTGVYDMPDCIEVIEDMVFQSNHKITGINFSKNLRRVGTSCFYDTPGISDYDFPDALEYIGPTCFFLNSAVKQILLPNNDVTICNNALSATGISSLVFPEGVTDIGVNADGTYSVMGMCGSLEWVSLPSTLTRMCPIASGCSALKAIYSFAVKPAVLSGDNAVDLAVEIVVPEGTADAYRAAWGALYPNVTYREALPAGGVTVDCGEGTVTLGWEAYADNLYEGTPVNYNLTLTQNDEEVADEAFDGRAGAMTHTVSGLEAGTYGYTLKGYDPNRRVTLLYTGTVELATGGVELTTVGDAADDAVVELYDLQGRRIADPQTARIYIERRIDAAGNATVIKHVAL